MPLAVGVALMLVLTGCSTGPSAGNPGPQVTDTDSPQAPTPGAEITIPDGAYAASSAFPFPIPNGWQVLDEFTESRLGKNVSMDASVEYPGDAKDAAATYLDLLKSAGFDAYVYGPGELTNQASLAAEGVINGILYLTILNFDLHADGYQRVSIIAAERD
jgi:hypothetical protein